MAITVRKQLLLCVTPALRRCRRAFGRLAERWGEARQELKELKDLKKQQWKATVASAVRGQLGSAPEPPAVASASPSGRAALSAEERAVLGRDGLVRVCSAWRSALACDVGTILSQPCI